MGKNILWMEREKQQPGNQTFFLSWFDRRAAFVAQFYSLSVSRPVLPVLFLCSCCGLVKTMRVITRYGPLGLRWRRLAEWAAVLRAERRNLTLPVWWGMVRASLRVCVAGRSLSRTRQAQGQLRTCLRCPIAGRLPAGPRRRGIPVCRPFPGTDLMQHLGCGCYAPYAVAAGKRCWANQHLPESGLGYS
jgi:hypothetical protein